MPQQQRSQLEHLSPGQLMSPQAPRVLQTLSPHLPLPHVCVSVYNHQSRLVVSQLY